MNVFDQFEDSQEIAELTQDGYYEQYIRNTKFKIPSSIQYQS